MIHDRFLELMAKHGLNPRSSAEEIQVIQLSLVFNS